MMSASIMPEDMTSAMRSAAGLVVEGGHLDLGAEIGSGVIYALVVGGDDDA